MFHVHSSLYPRKSSYAMRKPFSGLDDYRHSGEGLYAWRCLDAALKCEIYLIEHLTSTTVSIPFCLLSYNGYIC
ncbi:hypothetical protein ACS0TY_033235 [Phlomoides rotata]